MTVCHTINLTKSYQFDKVINADTEEPSIQFYYTLQVQYTMINDETFQKIEEQKQLQKKNETRTISRKEWRMQPLSRAKNGECSAKH